MFTSDPNNDALVWLLVGLVVFGFLLVSALLKMETDEEEKRLQKEKERKARIKALYPENPSYEERMGVKYGTDKND